MTTKKCSKCGEVKALDEFYRDVTLASGFRSECKACRIAAGTKYKRSKGMLTQDEYLRRIAVSDDHKKRRLRTNQARYMLRHPDRVRETSQKNRDTLTDSYIICGLLGMRKSDASPELVEVKREQIAIRRMTKQLTNTIKDKRNDD